MAAPNVLWITLDSVRADHTTIGGYERDTTPEMADIGASGEAFDTCIAHSKATLGSSGSILTGYAPSRHTLSVDGEVLPEEIPTIPERFQDAGYRTACLSRNSFVSDATQLSRGFDRFQWLAAETVYEVGPRTMLGYLWNIREHSAGLTTDTAKHATPYLMNATARRWLSSLGDAEPFFFYLHYNEPHRPYYPPGMYLDAFTEDLPLSGRDAAELSLDIHRDLKEIVASGTDLSETDWAALRATYDAEIAYTDEMIGRLVDHLRTLDLGPTVVVVTADHGELFGEYGLLSHKYVLTDAITRVPLAIDAVGADLADALGDDLAVDGDDIVQHADVMRTLLGAAGHAFDDGVGVDLRVSRREVAVSQRGPVDFDDLYTHDPDFDASRFHHGLLTALRTETHRYQESEDGADLFALPDEGPDDDVSEAEPDLTKALADRLADWFEEHGRPGGTGRSGEFSDAVQRQLKDLGYVD